MTEETPQRAIHVVAGVLIDRQRRVLIAQRPAGKHMAGAWEFPGGKLEPGETPLEGLSRELAEEIGVHIEQPRRLLRLRHRYAYGEVLLDVWVVRRFRGEPRSLDGQALRWCRRSALEGANLLPGDRPIIDALRLPERLERRESPHYRLRVAAAFRGRLALRREPGRLEGAICRGSNEARDACAGGADFLVVSNALAPAALRALCAEVSSPVYARGVSLAHAWALGATGVNALGG